MTKTYDAEEVAKHNTAESCWVILYGQVYDVTDFISQHPGGSRIILQLAGKDATEEYDPVHPPGTLEENLKPECKLGPVDADSLAKLAAAAAAAAEKSRNYNNNNDQQTSAQQDPGAVGKEEPLPIPPMEHLLNLDEIEAVATRRVPKKAWAYYYSASDDLRSKRNNNEAYKQILLRPRVFRDCTKADQSTTLLGYKLGTPLYVSPAAMARLGHPDGEAGIAKGISGFGAAYIVSHNASQTPEQIVADAPDGQIFGWQIYVQTDRKRSETWLARINKLRKHFKFVVLTLDAPVPGKREEDERTQFGATQVVTAASTGESKPGGGGIGQQMFYGTAADLEWHTTLPWLAQHTDLPIVLKGVQTHEDAYLAAQWAAQHPGSIKAVILSNHGGRALDTAPPAIHTLMEIRKYCPEVLSQIEVWVDGGIKRGTDIVKALCLGARGVGVGRAALWGLGAGGTRGVERTFEILTAEIRTCMQLLGAETISQLGPRFVNTRALERDIFDGDAGLDRQGLWVAKAKL